MIGCAQSLNAITKQEDVATPSSSIAFLNASYCMAFAEQLFHDPSELLGLRLPYQCAYEYLRMPLRVRLDFSRKRETVLQEHGSSALYSLIIFPPLLFLRFLFFLLFSCLQYLPFCSPCPNIDFPFP